MRSISLPNRYYKTIKLIEQKNGKWKFDEQAKYFRFLYNKSVTKIIGIDPEGGPLISVGDIISGWQVKSINAKSEITMVEVDDVKTV
jgi:hypothetical protein